jgi:hypothetical protein
VSEIFISHVEEDEGIALGIARELERAGYRTWYYERDADPGPSYLIQVHRAIERCRAIVIVISPAAVRSNQMTVEVVRGHEAGKPFLPVRSGITHSEFQRSQQEWRMALGASASLAVPPEGAVAVAPRLIRGLQGLGIEPGAGVSDGARVDRPTRGEHIDDPTPDPGAEAEHARRDAEFVELRQRLDEQCDQHDYADALATAEAMLRLRPGDPKALGARAFISERLARSASRRGLVHRLTSSKWRTALLGAGALLVVLLGIGLFSRDEGSAPIPPPTPAPVTSAVPVEPPKESPAPSPPVKETPSPPARPAPPRRQAPPVVAQAPPVVAQAPPVVAQPLPTPPPAPRVAPYRGVDVIGRMPTVVQVYDPT